MNIPLIHQREELHFIVEGSDKSEVVEKIREYFKVRLLLYLLISPSISLLSAAVPLLSFTKNTNVCLIHPACTLFISSRGSVMKLGDSNAYGEVEVIPTGSISLDISLGLGGIPKGIKLKEPSRQRNLMRSSSLLEDIF